MSPVSTNIKIDPALKKEAQQLFGNLGMNLSTAVNLFLRQAVREQAIPFRVGEPMPNAANGIDLYGPFNTVDELMEALNADD